MVLHSQTAKQDQSSECERTEHVILAQITRASLNLTLQASLDVL